MKEAKFAIITPSYAPDFERCELLAHSVHKFVSSPDTTHYIIVDKRDLSLFKQLRGPRTEIITVESVLPWWLMRLPFVQKAWLSFKTVPVRNWLLQQIVKIGIGKHIGQDVLIFVDSDVSFVRPFDPSCFIKGDQVRLFHAEVNAPREVNQWELSAAKLLGFDPQPLPNYIGNIITWRRDNLLKMYERIESVSGQGLVETLCQSWHLSEYVLYGAFVDYVLKEKSGHYWGAEPLCKSYWGTDDLSDEQLVQFFQDINPEAVAVMISAKAKIPPKRYQALVEAVPQPTSLSA